MHSVRVAAAAARAADAARPWRSEAFPALDSYTCTLTQGRQVAAVATATPFLHTMTTTSTARPRGDPALSAATPNHLYAAARAFSFYLASVRVSKPSYGTLLCSGHVLSPTSSVYVKACVAARRFSSHFRRIARLPLDTTLRQNLRCMQVTHLTHVQDVTFFTILSGKDVVVVARCGTGKTLAYLLPLLQRLLSTGALSMCGVLRPGGVTATVSDSVSQQWRRREDSRDERREKKWKQQLVHLNDTALSDTCDYTSLGGAPAAVILVPTRELCRQVASTALSLLPALSVVVADSGTALHLQKHQLTAGPVDVVIGTPSRCLLLQQRGDLHFQNARCIVLDEADLLLSRGYADKVGQLLELNGYPGWAAAAQNSGFKGKQTDNSARHDKSNAGRACNDSHPTRNQEPAGSMGGSYNTVAGKSISAATERHAARLRWKAVEEKPDAGSQSIRRKAMGTHESHLRPTQAKEQQDERERRCEGSCNNKKKPAMQLILFSSLMPQDVMKDIKARLPDAVVFTLLKNKKGKIPFNVLASEKVLLCGHRQHTRESRVEKSTTKYLCGVDEEE